MMSFSSRALALALAFALVFTTARSAFAVDKAFSTSLVIGAPHPANLAFDYRASDRFSFGVQGGFLALPFNDTNGNKYNLGISNVEGRVRWHPFGGAFLIGVAVGAYQNIHGTADIPVVVSGVTVPAHVDATIKSLYVTPHLGWFWVLGNGLTLGLEAGVQLPVSPSTTITPSVNDPTYSSYLPQVEATAQYQQLQTDMVNLANRAGSQAFPMVTVLRFGWSF